MQRIAVFADTHIPERAHRLPARLLKALAGVDQIWHAGDATTRSVLDELALVAPVIAVRGNMDLDMPDLPRQQRLHLEGITVQLVHGHGYPKAELGRHLLLAYPDADLIVHGHTHQAFWGRVGTQWVLNPGSPFDPGRTGRGTFGMLMIQDSRITGEIITVP
jgi:hypothetical protein